jgi:adenosylhomocysteine nucleosidase
MIYVTYAMPEEAPRVDLPPGALAIQTGIGKVLAVTKLSQAILKEPAEMVISVGFCGGLNGTPQGSMVMASETRQWDLYLDAPIPLGHGYAMHCPMQLAEIEVKSVPNPVCGRIISGDRFVDSTVHVSKEAVAVDMETAALAVLCGELNIPLVSIREVSDVADGPQGMPHQQFMDYIKEKGPAYSDAVLEMIERGPKGIAAPQKAGESS